MIYEPLIGLFLFTKKGDKNHIYRSGLREEEIKILQKIKNHPMIPNFIDTGDVMTIGNSKRVNCPVFKIDKIPYELRIQDLTKKQRKKMLLNLIDLITYCLKKEICIWDVSESNVLYWNGKVYYVDLDGFSSIHDKHRNMHYSFVKLSYMFNKYLKDNYILTNNTQANHITIKKYKDWTSRQTRNFNDINLWIEFKKVVSDVNCVASNSHWADNYAVDDAKVKENNKVLIVKDLLKPTYGGTVLDIGTNKGYYLDIIKDNYEYLIGFDIDDKCIDLAEEKYGCNKIAFTKLAMNDFFSGSRLTDSRITRFKSDLVLALAVTHHFKNSNVDAKKSAQAMCDLSDKWILIEDIENQSIYSSIFKNNGFSIFKSVASYPSSRSLTLWVRS
jgi:2-polyprenyl-3-methyl-5-hydroxy-6-metoxy-1,4-benzoquinol methylase